MPVPLHLLLMLFMDHHGDHPERFVLVCSPCSETARDLLHPGCSGNREENCDGSGMKRRDQGGPLGPRRHTRTWCWPKRTLSTWKSTIKTGN